MSFEGTVMNGTVVFDEPLSLPDGTRVDVAVKESATPTLGERLSALAGIAKGMPADFAAEHDHYIHGTPRRHPRAEG